MAGSLSSGLALLLAGFPALACAGHTVENPTSFEIYLAEAPLEAPRYELQAGDELEVRFLHAPEQNVLLVVRPDGFVSVPLANELRAAGRTPEELRLDITAAWARQYREPEVAVVLKKANAYKIHVGGAVASPGIFELGGERNVLDALFEAGGFLPTADLEQVLVIRPAGPGRFAVIPLDLTAVLDASDPRQNLALRPRDAVYVPISAIAEVNRWVDQYIRQNIPISFGWSLEVGGQ